jgi:hypothetical protein
LRPAGVAPGGGSGLATSEIGVSGESVIGLESAATGRGALCLFDERQEDARGPRVDRQAGVCAVNG